MNRASICLFEKTVSPIKKEEKGKIKKYFALFF
jgi:hypothetical protein